MSTLANVSLGHYRALQMTATATGHFTILAADHRDSLRAVINPDDPNSVADEQLIELKSAVVANVAPYASAVLLDPLYSAMQTIALGHLPGSAGLIVALEEQGYLGNPHARQQTLLHGWSAAKAKRLGANGAKVLLMYHPDSPTAAAQEALVASVVADCRRAELPLFLEPIMYPPTGDIDPRAPEFRRTRKEVLVRAAKRLGALGPGVLKLEFPVDADLEPDPETWVDACVALNEASPVPWALLSGGVPFDLFAQQLEVACRAGCSGFMVGRALWKEAVPLTGAARTAQLQNGAVARFAQLSEIAQTYGQPWWERVNRPVVDINTYHTY